MWVQLPPSPQSMYRILLDYGHGIDTKGKQSPDGRFKEYAFAREVGRTIAEDLRKFDLYFTVHEIVTEETDISLTERCNRVNKIIEEYPGDECFLVSIHANAAGNGSQWMNARGWQVHVHTRASDKSKVLADYFSWAAQKLNCKVRKPLPTQNYWQNNYKILRDTKCPAVLTENFFYDNKEDLEYLLSKEGKETVINIHVIAICDFLGIPYSIVTG